MRIQVRDAKAKLGEMLGSAIQGENIFTKPSKDTAEILSMDSYQCFEPQPNISTWQALRDDENLLDNQEVDALFARDKESTTLGLSKFFG
jgi:hypothetical protein